MSGVVKDMAEAVVLEVRRITLAAVAAAGMLAASLAFAWWTVLSL